MSEFPFKPLVLVPAYNPGRRLRTTVAAALAVWPDVWVVVDGSTDESHAWARDPRNCPPGLRVIERAQNGGKGAAVLDGAEAALADGFSHALVLDADGQHPTDRIADFIVAAREAPSALIAGRPVFGSEVPKVRLYGRQLSIGLVHLETLGRVIADPLFGFRVYPLAALVAVMRRTRGARRYDFDPEVATRLTWMGVPVINRDAACRYLSSDEGGVSHFHYFRDNRRMVWLHVRLLAALFFCHAPAILRRRLFSPSIPSAPHSV